MKKETLVEKMARKAFESSEVQKSWAVHMQAFGPILEPAFAEDYQTRVELTAALNKISRRDLKGGMDKLKKLQEKCVSNADKAAWLFFMGVCMEMAGAREQMISCYQKAGYLGHRFYLPYLKVAKAAHGDMVLDLAEEYYQSAIECLKEAAPSAQNRMILASAYTNLSAVLTMMHRHDDAFNAMELSYIMAEKLPGRSGTAAIAAAAEGDFARAEEQLEALKQEAPQMLAQVCEVVEKLRQGTHPHFFAQEIPEGDIADFWSWFAAEKRTLSAMVSQEKFADAAALLQERLVPIFAFSDKKPELALEAGEGSIQLALADFYSVGLRSGYERLLDACPEDVMTGWSFCIER